MKKLLVFCLPFVFSLVAFIFSGHEVKAVFDSFTVPAYSASGVPVHILSTPLVSGTQYKITVTGTYDANDGITADAEYSTRPLTNSAWTDSVSTYESYGEQLLDLFVGSDHDWGSYASDHTYTKTVTGTGSALDFYINDVYPQNNSGSLAVTIEEITPEPTSATVHIFKYIDGEQATVENAGGVNFPMFTSTYNAPFTLGPAGWTTGDIAYEASTSPMALGSSYSAEENLSTPLVGGSCDGSHQYALVGYSIGNTLPLALQSIPSLTIPSFTNLAGDKYIVVRNTLCPPTRTIQVHILKYLDGKMATLASSKGYAFPMTATWRTANLNGGVSTSGNYVLGNFHGGSLNQYGADTSPMNVPADYTTREITNSPDSKVVTDRSACAEGKYLLKGYRTSSVGFADAALKPLSVTAPVFTALSADQYVIVSNKSCPVKRHENRDNCKKDGWRSFSHPSFRNQGQCVSYFEKEDHGQNDSDDQEEHEERENKSGRS